MPFKKLFSLVCFTIFIQSSHQQTHAITEQQTNIASYIIAAGAGAATGGLVFYALEQNDAQQQKSALAQDIENSDNDVTVANSAKKEPTTHTVRNLIIGTICGVAVGVLAYKISDNILAPRLIDQETHFCELKLFIRDSKDGKLREVLVPDNFMLDNSPENFGNFLNWIKETYKDSYECEYQKKETVQRKNLSGSSSSDSFFSGRFTLNHNAPDQVHIEEMPSSYNTLLCIEGKPSSTETPQATEDRK